MDEDLFMEERRMRWRMMETAKRERAKGKRIVVMNRELWAEGRRWNWDADHVGMDHVGRRKERRAEKLEMR